MYKLLLVDDELSVLEALTTLEWDTLGISVVLTARNGRQALEIMRSQLVDIIITDIRMPGMSGMELIEQINRNWNKVKCIVLSGYSDFSYAQEAIRQGAYNYLLKPVSDEDLFEAVAQAVAQMKQEWEAANAYQKAMYTLREHLPLLRSVMLSNLLQGQNLSSRKLEEKMIAYKLPSFVDRQAALVMVRLEGNLTHYDNLHLLEYAITNVMEEMLSPYLYIWHCKDPHEYLVYAIAFRNEMLEQAQEQQARQHILQDLIERAQENILAYLKIPVSVLLSTWGLFPQDMNRVYQHALTNMVRRFGEDERLFLALDKLDERPASAVTALKSLYEPPSILHLFDAGRWDMIVEKLKRVFEELENSAYNREDNLLELYLNISNAFCYYAHKNGKRITDILGSDLVRLIDQPHTRNSHKLKEWALTKVDTFKNEFKSEIKESRFNLVEQVQHYIEAHLSDDISMQAIADHVHLHPVYLSKVYKLETTENLSDYILRIKMEKAAYLLKTTKDKIYQIGEQLGYQNNAYFIRVFKKHYGVTPVEYREG